MLASSSSAAATDAAIAALRRGGAVVYPTETFYGLGVDATDDGAIAHLRRLKLRAEGKPISVLISNLAMLTALVREIPAGADRLMQRFWPGPLTLVLPASASISRYLTAGGETIGVRWSSHAFATALVAAVGHPLTTPSANPAGAEPPVTLAQARAYFGDTVDTYLDGGTLAGGLGSTVVEVEPVVRIVRNGVIPASAIADALALES